MSSCKRKRDIESSDCESDEEFVNGKLLFHSLSSCSAEFGLCPKCHAVINLNDVEPHEEDTKDLDSKDQKASEDTEMKSLSDSESTSSSQGLSKSRRTLVPFQQELKQPLRIAKPYRSQQQVVSMTTTSGQATPSSIPTSQVVAPSHLGLTSGPQSTTATSSTAPSAPLKSAFRPLRLLPSSTPSK